MSVRAVRRRSSPPRSPHRRGPKSRPSGPRPLAYRNHPRRFRAACVHSLGHGFRQWGIAFALPLNAARMGGVGCLCRVRLTPSARRSMAAIGGWVSVGVADAPLAPAHSPSPRDLAKAAGREIAAAAVILTGAGRQWMPWTISPPRSLADRLALFVPAAALFVAAVRSPRSRTYELASVALIALLSAAAAATRAPPSNDRADLGGGGV